MSDVKQEYKKFWKENKLWIILGVIAAIVIIDQLVN